MLHLHALVDGSAQVWMCLLGVIVDAGQAAAQQRDDRAALFQALQLLLLEACFSGSLAAASYAVQDRTLLAEEWVSCRLSTHNIKPTRPLISPWTSSAYCVHR